MVATNENASLEPEYRRHRSGEGAFQAGGLLTGGTGPSSGSGLEVKVGWWARRIEPGWLAGRPGIEPQRRAYL